MPVEGSGAIAPARLCANREERNDRPEEELRVDHQALCAWARRHRRWRRRPRRGQLLRQQVRAHHLHLSRPEGLRGQGNRRRHRGQPVLQVVLRQLGRAPGGRCPGCPRDGPGGFRPSQEQRRAASGRGQGDALRRKLGLHPLCGGGSGTVDTSTAPTLKEALESVGFQINPTMWSFYTEGAASSIRMDVADIAAPAATSSTRPRPSSSAMPRSRAWRSTPTPPS